ncbi:MAG: hypothetical protein ACRDAO_01165 [Culicoidibacterales bacterium]
MNKIINMLVCSIILLGFFIPSNYIEISILLSFFSGVVLFFYTKKIKLHQLLISFLLLSILMFYTLINSDREILLGSVQIITLILISNSDFKKIGISNKVVLILSSVLITIAIMNILDITIIDNLILQHYNTYNNVHYAVEWSNKPVAFFDMHSLAGGVYGIFSLLNLYIYFRTRNKIYVFYGLIFILLLIFLNSVTSIVSFLIISSVYLFEFYKKTSINNKKYFLLLTFSVAFCIFLLMNDTLKEVFGSDINGLAGRFSENGILINNLQQIIHNPFYGVGFTENTDLFYGDSGMVNFINKANIIGAFLYYYLIYRVFNEQTMKSGKVIFIYILLLEIGTNFLFYPRTIGLLLLVLIKLKKE